MKTKKNTNEETVESPYPDGYLDEQSPFFISESLRQTWLETGASEYHESGSLEDLIAGQAKFEATRQVLAEISSNSATPEDTRLPGYQFNVFSAQKTDEYALIKERQKLLLLGSYEEMRRRALHAQRLRFVVATFTMQQEAAHKKDVFDEANRCPHCGASNPKQNGPIETRSLLPAFPLPMFPNEHHPRLRSCAACHLLAVDEYRLFVGAEATANFKLPTRRDAVRAEVTQIFADLRSME